MHSYIEEDSNKTKDASLAKSRSVSQKGSKLMLDSRGDGTATAALRVFVYDLPPKFNWAISGDRSAPATEGRDLSLDPQVSIDRKILAALKKLTVPKDNVPVYEGGPQTRSHSVEYFLSLSLIFGVPSVVLVDDEKTADIFFVPFFASISFNRYMAKGKPHSGVQDDGIGPKDRSLQEELVSFLKKQSAWKRHGGKDHVIVAHHPKALTVAAPVLKKAIFVVADFQHHNNNVSNIDKDIVAPYKSPVAPYEADKGGWESRKTLLYFKGSVKRHKGGWVRQRLLTLLPGQPDVVYEDSKPTWENVDKAQEGMRNSKFCLVPGGDTPSSSRLFDAILSHCIPIIISDFIELPFEDVLDYSLFSIILPSIVAAQQSVVETGPGHLLDFLRAFPRDKWEKMYKQLKKVRKHFVYSHPVRAGGAEDMIWQAIARRIRGESSDKFRRARSDKFTKDLKDAGLDKQKRRRGKWQNRLQRLTEKERQQKSGEV